MNTDLMKSELVFEVRPESLFQMLFPLETQSSNLYLFVHYQKQNMHQRLVNQLKSFHYNLFPFLFTSSVYFCEHDIFLIPSFPRPAVHYPNTLLMKTAIVSRNTAAMITIAITSIPNVCKSPNTKFVIPFTKLFM